MDKERNIIILFAVAIALIIIATVAILSVRSVRESRENTTDAGHSITAADPDTGDSITNSPDTEENGLTTASQDSAPVVTEDPGTTSATAPATSQELTTKAPDTTAAPVTTETPSTTSPAVTTQAPVVTTSPAVTTQTPAATTSPEVTTAAPVVTTSPAVTTTAPETTSTPTVSTSVHTFVFSYTNDGNMVLLQNTGKTSDMIYPASLTKLVTALTVMEYAGNRLEDEVTVEAADLKLVGANSSLANLTEGMRLSVDQLLSCMLIPSGNDAAYVLARYVGSLIDPSAKTASAKVSAFVKKMNEWSVSNALLNSSWKNPDGYHATGHYTTMSDMMIIVLRTVKNKHLNSIVSSGAKTITTLSGEELFIKCTNLLLDPDSAYYNPACTGIKTGYTAYAGNCLVASFEKNGVTYFTGLFGLTDANERFRQANALFKKYSG